MVLHLFIPVFYTLLVTTGVIQYGFVLRVTQGHLYMWRTPLLAPVSTVGKTRLVVVAVQGAPPGILSLSKICDDATSTSETNLYPVSGGCFS